MITITIYGLDQYIVGHLSKDLTPALAEIYEVSQDDINFIAPNAMVFHKGVEQTSWNAIVKVNAPLKVKVLQNDVATILLSQIVGPTIHVTVEFYYYSQDDRYEKINDEYPRYIEEDNVVNIEEEHYDENMIEGDGADEIYTGDIFKDFNKK